MIQKTATLAVAYYRMSSDKQQESIPSQREAVERFAAKHGYIILREYIDAGIAGWKSEERVEFQRLIADAATDEFSVVLCWDIDRFSRFPILEANHYWYLLDREGVKLATVNQGELDFQDLGSWLTASVTQHGKAEYVKDLSRNVTRGMIRAAREGKCCGGPANYGYKWRGDGFRVIDDATAEVVRTMFDMYARGESLRSIGRHLNQQGIGSAKGGKWTAGTIRQILKNRVYLGEAVWNRRAEGKYHRVIGGVTTPTARFGGAAYSENDDDDLIVVYSAHEAIIEHATYDKVQERFSTNKHRTQKRVWPLAGLLYCADCGGPMGGKFERKVTDGKSYDYWQYLCRAYSAKGSAGCYCNKIHEGPLMQCIIKKIQESFLNPRDLERLRAELNRQLDCRNTGTKHDTARQQRQLSNLDAEIDKAKRRIVEVDADMLSVVQDHLRELRDKRRTLEANIWDAESPQRDTKKDSAEIVDRAMDSLWTLQERLETADRGQLRELMGEVVERVDLSFDHEPMKSYTRNRFSRGVIQLNGIVDSSTSSTAPNR